MIEIRQVESDVFGSLFDAHALTPYDTVSFGLLNARRVEGDVRLLVFEDEKATPICGLIAGVCEGVLLAPYSAPFAWPTWLVTPKLAQACEVADALVKYAQANGLGLNLFMPPSIYVDGDTRAKWITALRSVGVAEAYADINYHFETSRLSAGCSLETVVGHYARVHLKRARKRGLMCSVCDDPARAFDIIKRNRIERGYPLRMTFEQVIETTQRCVAADWFVVSGDEVGDCAAALVYRLSDQVVQVIYWGDIPQLKGAEYCMLVLADGVFGHYADRGIKYVDVGPASENGIASPGLCNFKELIGCTATLKPRYVRP